MGLASLINIYVCEIVYLFQDQTKNMGCNSTRNYSPYMCSWCSCYSTLRPSLVKKPSVLLAIILQMLFPIRADTLIAIDVERV